MKIQWEWKVFYFSIRENEKLCLTNPLDYAPTEADNAVVREGFYSGISFKTASKKNSR